MDIKFVKARNYTETGSAGRRVDLIVEHLMVTDEESDKAEWCANYFASPSAPQASAHYCRDDNSIVQGVRDEDVAWAAPGANSDGIQIENAGTLQTPAGWDDKYSRALLTGELEARLCKKHGIPAIWRDAADLRAGKRGITDHWETTKAFGLSTHTDNGQGFRDRGGRDGKSAKEVLMKNTRERLEPDHDKHVDHERVELPDVHEGDVGHLVKKAQTHLVRHGYLHKSERDGIFGERTARAVRRFQRDQEINVSGIVDRKTWRRLRS